jgi:hypothetical protein
VEAEHVHGGCLPAGNPADTPAYAPADHWTPHLPALSQLVTQAGGVPGKIPTGADQRRCSCPSLMLPSRSQYARFPPLPGRPDITVSSERHTVPINH